MKIDKEEWKNIEGYEGYYQISNCGRVRSMPRVEHHKDKYGREQNRHLKGCIMKPTVNPHGYYTVCLKMDGNQKQIMVHILVARHFVHGYFEGAEINHKDEIKTNNLSTNLEWVSHLDNIRHGTGIKRGRDGRDKNWPVSQYDKEGRWLATYCNMTVAGKLTGVNANAIAHCVCGKNKTAGGYVWTRK